MSVFCSNKSLDCFVSQLKEVIKKFYKSGKCFLILCPDGTGNVLYPFKQCIKWRIKDWVKALMRGYTFVPFDERFAQC